MGGKAGASSEGKICYLDDVIKLMAKDSTGDKISFASPEYDVNTDWRRNLDLIGLFPCQENRRLVVNMSSPSAIYISFELCTGK